MVIFVKSAEGSPNPHLISDRIVSVAFNPIYNHELRQEEISLCDASEYEPKEALQVISEHNPQKEYMGVACLEGSDLEEFGFSLQRDDKPFIGHVNAFMSREEPLSDDERKLIRNELKARAIHNGVWILGENM